MPALTPATERINVVTPIKETAGIILTLKNASVTPTARASMLVATARMVMVLKSTEGSSSSDSQEAKDSLIILIPMMTSRTKAIQ